MSRSLAIWAVTAAAAALALAPAVVVFGLGWLSVGAESAESPLASPGSPLRWALFAVAYAVWMFLLMLALIVAYDRLGHHWRSWDRSPRPSRKRRRRVIAGMRYLEGQENAREEVARPRAGHAAAGDGAVSDKGKPRGKDAA